MSVDEMSVEKVLITQADTINKLLKHGQNFFKRFNEIKMSEDEMAGEKKSYGQAKSSIK
jgi:hypothetical protein